MSLNEHIRKTGLPLTQDEINYLEITAEELNRAIKTTPLGKSPGRMATQHCFIKL